MKIRIKTSIKKKLALLLTLVTVVISISGCNMEPSDYIKGYMTTNLGNMLYERFNQNQAILDRLFASGVITKAVYENSTKNIENQLKQYLVEDEDGGYIIEFDWKNPLKSPLVKALVGYRPLDLPSIPSGTVSAEGVQEVFTFPENYDLDTKKSDIEKWVLSNLLARAFVGGGYDFNEWYIRKEKEKEGNNELINIEPIKVIPDNLFKDLADYKIMVLKPEQLQSDNIDNIRNLITSIVDENGMVKDKAAKMQLDSLFTTAVDSNGKEITLMDLIEIDDIVVTSEGYEGENIGEAGNRPGKDLLVKQTILGTDHNIMKIRLQEFDYDAVNKLLTFLGNDMNTGEATKKWAKFDVSKIGSLSSDSVNNHNLYLMEYPVFFIEGLQESEGDNNYVEAVIKRSDIGVNLLTGDIINYKYEGNEIVGSSVVQTKNENNEVRKHYLTMDGKASINAESQSSFFVSGIASLNIGQKSNGEDITFQTGRIILRDYLEITYAPGLEKDDNNGLAVLGRKLRFVNMISEAVDNKEYDTPIRIRTELPELRVENKNKIMNTPYIEATPVKSGEGQIEIKSDSERAKEEAEAESPEAVTENETSETESPEAVTEDETTEDSGIIINDSLKDKIKDEDDTAAELIVPAESENNTDVLDSDNIETDTETEVESSDTEIENEANNNGSTLRFRNVNMLYTEIPLASEDMILNNRNGFINRSEAKQTRILFKKNVTIMEFIDREGKILNDTKGLKVEDLCDINNLINDNVIVSLCPNNTAEGVYSPVKDDDTSSTKGLQRVNVRDYIQTTTRFPGPIVGQADFRIDNSKFHEANNKELAGITSHQVFYGIMTASDMFETNLFTSWIATPNLDSSINWWISYLFDNNYVYKLSISALEDFLEKGYTYELQKSGIVILDLETVAKIQREMDLEREADTSRNIRTMFKIIGWGIILYSLILFLAWMVDTNTDIGIQLTTNMTLGNWIPIKDLQDMPYIDSSGVKYVDLKKVVINCMIIILVGILMIYIDVYDIALLVIRSCGVLALKINELLTGFR